MKVLTYFSFTLLSILIQFSVMDFLQSNEEKGIDLNLTTPKTRLHDIIKDLGIKPHALYYNNQKKNDDMNKQDVNKKIYGNTSLADIEQINTDTISTVFDILLYENNSITESDFTTDSEYTTIGFDNVTEITLFVPKNETNSKSDKTPSLKYNSDCDCNLLYETCDVNCCCDSDCDNSLKNMFNCMDVNKKTQSNEISELCFSPLSYSGKSQNILDNMFCIVKKNLPEHRKIIKHNYVNTVADNKYLKWQQSENPKHLRDFTKVQYKIGDPVWLLKNTSLNHIDLPTSMVNNYCAGRKPITFLKDEVINCIVKYQDLEMFNILKIAEQSIVISAKDITINSTDLNCTTLHCTNWTVLVSDGVHRTSYNKKNHKPICYKHTCTNIALNIDYFFHYYDSRLANVSVTLHIRNISTVLMFISQRINVKFLLGNKTDEQMSEFSGSPGYKKGLMLLISSTEGNYTDNFYQSKISQEKYLSLPINANGQCVSPNSKQDFIQFGINKRIKCRYFYNHSHNNDINVCDYIQGNITELFRLNNKIFISPYGNPYDLKDEDWIQLRIDNFDKDTVYEKVDTSIHCYNVITKITLTFVFMSVNYKDNNTILSLNVAVSTTNISFTTLEDISTIVTTDINFINVSKRPILEYAGRPHLNINIPKDFFFSYPSNNSKGNNNKCIFNTFSYSAVYIFFFTFMKIK